MSGMKTKAAFTWPRGFSSTGPLEVPAGAPVEWHEANKCFYVKPSFFEGAILQHDAEHYGCRVDADNVIQGD